jgi:hypothetical protein
MFSVRCQDKFPTLESLKEVVEVEVEVEEDVAEAATPHPSQAISLLRAVTQNLTVEDINHLMLVLTALKLTVFTKIQQLTQISTSSLQQEKHTVNFILTTDHRITTVK